MAGVHWGGSSIFTLPLKFIFFLIINLALKKQQEEAWQPEQNIQLLIFHYAICDRGISLYVSSHAYGLEMLKGERKKTNWCSHRHGVWNMSSLILLKDDDLQKAFRGPSVVHWHKLHLHYRGHMYIAGRYLICSLHILYRRYMKECWNKSWLKIPNSFSTGLNYFKE